MIVLLLFNKCANLFFFYLFNWRATSFFFIYLISARIHFNHLIKLTIHVCSPKFENIHNNNFFFTLCAHTKTEMELNFNIILFYLFILFYNSEIWLIRFINHSELIAIIRDILLSIIWLLNSRLEVPTPIQWLDISQLELLE